MKKLVLFSFALLLTIASVPIDAGELCCKACNMKFQGKDVTCLQQRTVVAYRFWKMGPALFSDGKADNLKLIDRRINVYYDHKCTKLMKHVGIVVWGCKGSLYPSNLPENDGVL